MALQATLHIDTLRQTVDCDTLVLAGQRKRVLSAVFFIYQIFIKKRSVVSNQKLVYEVRTC